MDQIPHGSQNGASAAAKHEKPTRESELRKINSLTPLKQWRTVTEYCST